VQIDGDIETLALQRSSEGDVVAEALEPRISGYEYDLVQMRVATDDGGGRRLHDICEVPLRVPSPQGPYQGRGEHDVTQEAKTNQQYLHQPEALGPAS
jgi:hypothetical protein